MTPKRSGMGFAQSHPGIPSPAAFHHLSLGSSCSHSHAGCGCWESRRAGLPGVPSGSSGTHSSPGCHPKAPAAQLSLPRLPWPPIPPGITHRGVGDAPPGAGIPPRPARLPRIGMDPHFPVPWDAAAQPVPHNSPCSSFSKTFPGCGKRGAERSGLVLFILPPALSPAHSFGDTHGAAIPGMQEGTGTRSWPGAIPALPT